MIAPPLPRSLDELGAWSVYADWLLEATPDDWCGPHLARELAMPARPDGAALRAFQRAVRRPLTHLYGAVRGFATMVWCLGHVRALGVRCRGDWNEWRVAGALQRLARIVDEDARFARLESLSIDEYSPAPGWAALLAALPASCARIVLPADNTGDARELLDRLPRQVRTLELVRGMFALPGRIDELLVDDRLEELDLRRVLLSPEAEERLAAALAATRRLRVRLGRSGAGGWPEAVRERVVVGAPGEMALRDPATGALFAIPAYPLATQQLVNGIMPASMQVARAVAERYGLVVRDDTPRFRPDGSVVLRRAADGSVLLRVGRDDAVFRRMAVAIDGRLLAPYERAPLADGARLRLEGHEWRFVAALV